MNLDKEFYRNEILHGKAGEYTREILAYTYAWLPKVAAKLGRDAKLNVLDLGAGSCTTSLAISKMPFVGTITATDVSAERMKAMSQETSEFVGGELSKLSFREIDFNDPLPFGDNEFDLVVMDASLHHSRNIWVTLAEIRRVLVPGGIFVAQREAYTSPLTHWITFRRLLESPEVAAGVSENAYLVSQYDYYLRANGFIPEFLPVFESWKFRMLFFLNGILFSKYNIIARSTKS